MTDWKIPKHVGFYFFLLLCHSMAKVNLKKKLKKLRPKQKSNGQTNCKLFLMHKHLSFMHD